MPTTTTWNIRQQTLYLSSELPWHERRRLALIGILQPNENGKYYPRVWRIEASNIEEMEAILTELHIQLSMAR